MMEAAPGKISFKSIAPFVQSNRSLAETTQQLRVDLAVHQKRIQELEMENDFLRERIAEMEVADDDERIEMIAKRRVEASDCFKKVKLIKTAALKSIAALQRFVKVIDESIDEGAPLSSSGLFDKAYSPVARASVLEIVPESPPFSPPKVSSDISNLLVCI
ncbi:unnamed protein product [Toxocara canis]|uniref:Genome assembly, chromosome: II n=1 Tax=Toxocara canis TaxID=6265 RepID=A0A183U091_TOXCA|nr:unnamed protein product [Toxocara canis]